MKRDIILAGVGGQGVLSIAAIIARAALAGGLTVRQSEVHGMAQRGGAVLAHLRIADGPIASDLAPQGATDLIIAMEPLESLRYAAWLSPAGVLVTSTEPLVNIPDYPDVENILTVIRRFPAYLLVDAAGLAAQAGNQRTVNMVMVGAASPRLPLGAEALEGAISATFGNEFAEVNTRAFRLGREAALAPEGRGLSGGAL
ncbi:MAG: indolepyruvate oxidoreductase subunit beta [Spirochaetaceae bacterium]|jgi:indolepyruvate ferredoxin oxidoreductase beta subunit|nr:indolepyruvate oxidoreductase subunit beta [Spirochaetaceae bacterium]